MDLITSPPGKILEAIRRGDLREKRALIESLAEHPSERSVDILAEILEGESWFLRDLAGKALAHLGDAAVPRLRRLLASGLWYTRAAAARSLGRMGHEESLPHLVALLSDPNLTVQSAALASIADLVRAGAARDTARLFWNEGARRGEELGRILMDVHPDAGRAVMEHLSDPSSFLKEERVAEEVPAGLPLDERKNA
jgi:HEAT repeat protein